MKNLKYPVIFSLTFIVFLTGNNEWAKIRTYRFYKEFENPDQPIREELKKDDYLNDESETETLVINLWATWCGPCQKEIPILNQMAKKYENGNTLFLAITNEKEKDVREWIDLFKYEPEYFQLYENQRLINYIFSLNPNLKVKKGLEPELLPTNLIIHKNKILFFEQGYSENHLVKMDSILYSIQTK